MNVDWTPLHDALARCRAAKLSLPLWWRDDDATQPTAALEQLARLAEDVAVPVHLAVIPGRAQPQLASLIVDVPQLVPVTHGWRHENHAPPEMKKSEFGTARIPAEREIRQAHERMQTLFGDRYLPLFVPPWNRIDRALFPTLARAGFKGVSTFTARLQRCPVPGFTEINTHLDPIDWRGTRGLKSPELLIAELVAVLEDRLEATQDPTEPLGYLTHHLVHTEEIWDFSRQLLLELRAGGAYVQPLYPLMEKPDEPA